MSINDDMVNRMIFPEYPYGYDYFYTTIEGFKKNKQQAKDNSKTAQYRLGLIHAHGFGTPSSGVIKDDQKAVAYYRKSAAQGYLLADYRLASMYAEHRVDGKNSIQDAEAVKLYRKVATSWGELGSKAEKKLEQMYAQGRGILSPDEVSKKIQAYNSSAANITRWFKFSCFMRGMLWRFIGRIYNSDTDYGRGIALTLLSGFTKPSEFSQKLEVSHQAKKNRMCGGIDEVFIKYPEDIEKATSKILEQSIPTTRTSASELESKTSKMTPAHPLTTEEKSDSTTTLKQKKKQ